MIAVWTVLIFLGTAQAATMAETRERCNERRPKDLFEIQLMEGRYSLSSWEKTRCLQYLEAVIFNHFCHPKETGHWDNQFYADMKADLTPQQRAVLARKDEYIPTSAVHWGADLIDGERYLIFNHPGVDYYYILSPDGHVWTYGYDRYHPKQNESGIPITEYAIHLSYYYEGPDQDFNARERSAAGSPEDLRYP